MMIKRTVMILLAACMLLFGGCQLAKPESDSAKEHDKLIGVYITVNKSLYEGESVENNDVTPVYAECSEVTCTDADGVEYIDYVCEIPNVDGIMLSCFKFRGVGPDGEPSDFFTTDADEEICNVTTNLGNTSVKISGTVYPSRDAGEILLYFNPVYQTESGSVYVLPGDGEMFGSESDGTMEISISETYKQTENDQSQESASTVSVKVVFAEPYDKFVFVQMDSENNVIKTDTFTSSDLPERFTPDEQTAYFVVESHSESTIDRSVYDRNDDHFSILCSDGGSLLIKKQITADWQ